MDDVGMLGKRGGWVSEGVKWESRRARAMISSEGTGKFNSEVGVDASR